MAIDYKTLFRTDYKRILRYGGEILMAAEVMNLGTVTQRDTMRDRLEEALRIMDLLAVLIPAP